jgi:outer membrane protein insertion porin family
MRSVFIAVSIFLLSFEPFTAAEPLYAAADTTSYRIVYEHPVPDEVELAIGESRSDAHDADRQRSLILSHLAGFGYFSASLTVDRDSNIISVDPGERALLGSVTLYPENFPQRGLLLGKLDELQGRPFSQTAIEILMTEMLKTFEEEGRPFAVIQLDSLAVEVSERVPTVNLTMIVTGLDEVTLHTVRVEGNNETRDRLIFRKAGVFPGDRYSRERIDEIRPRLMRTGLFRSVAEPEVRIDREGGLLLLRVEEARFNSFDGIIGYVPTTGGEGYFTGLAHVTMRNLFGTMRRLEARWQRETELTQELFFSYREPYVAGLPMNAAISFRQRQQDTTFVQSRTKFIADTEVLRQFTVGLSYEYESVIPSAEVAVQAVDRSSLNLFGIDVRYDSRDDRYAPTGGMMYFTEYQTGRLRRETASGADGENLQRVIIDAEIYTPITRRHILKVGVHGREVRLGEFQVSDLFRFGGTRSLRGYGEGQFAGSRIAWSNIEYRFMQGRRTYLFGFFDSGYYYMPALDEEREPRDSFEYGYGVGLHLETGIGLISVGFGFGRGDTFSTGKIHIGLVNEF